MKFHLISLGCSKNTSDSEQIANRFAAAGWQWCKSAGQADLVMINTCGFIQDAKEESLAAIMQLVDLKNNHPTLKICVFGCLIKRYHAQISSEIPEIDYLFDFLSESQLNRLLELNPGRHSNPDYSQSWRFFTPAHIGILKIAEGCSNCCAYCAIPQIRGPFQSRSQADILNDARRLVASGAREISLVAQDITRYGTDISGHCTLPDLVKEVAKVAGADWLRLHYMHPRGLTTALLDELYTIPKVVPYFDIPFQHISRSVLAAMNRDTTPEHQISLLKHIRRHYPEATVRTTLIVGFPGEQKRDFERLISFIEEHAIDRLGAFAYSAEENTPAAKMRPQVRPSNRQARLDQLMTLQQLLAAERNQQLVGKTVKVMVDEVLDDKVLARTAGDAYEVDNTTIIQGRHQVKAGDLVKVRITAADAYDFTAELIQ